MRKTFFYAAFATLVACSIFTSCNSSEKKVDNANENVQEAKENLQEAQKELNAEYPAFKKDAEEKIAANEKRIDELQAKINKPGKSPLDEMRKKRIDTLKEKNAELRTRLYNYEIERSDWETFKREFNHDMEGIGDAFKDLGKDNTK